MSALMQDLRRSNFTSANCKNAKFTNSNLQGAFFMKAVSERKVAIERYTNVQPRCKFPPAIGALNIAPSHTHSLCCVLQPTAHCGLCSFANLRCTVLMWHAQVLYRTDFEGADLNDVLMDRAVLNEANLKNAQLQRAVLTR